jgi:hypothetical protein
MLTLEEPNTQAPKVKFSIDHKNEENVEKVLKPEKLFGSQEIKG